MIIESVNAFLSLGILGIGSILTAMKKQRKSNTPKKKVTGLKRFIQNVVTVLGMLGLERPEHKRFRQLLIILAGIVFLFVGTNYAVARYYIAKHSEEPFIFGATFIPNYATYLGADPKETMDAMIDELGIRNFRLVSYWKEIESQKGTYDFSDLDWQFQKAEASGSKVSLAIGLRQPRWPECHEPSWAKGRPLKEWYPELKQYMVAVVERYKNNPALESYQLENEFFLDVFGECTDFSRDRLIEEYNLVKATDPEHPIIVSRSNNIVGIPLGEPTPDISAVSVYKRVWDKSFTFRYVEYPYPAWFYSSLAGWGEITRDRSMIIHELQAEPWLPEQFDMPTAPISEQDKTLSPERLKDRIEYAKATGIKRIDLWGVEWWYARKEVRGDPSVWEMGKEELKKY